MTTTTQPDPRTYGPESVEDVTPGKRYDYPIIKVTTPLGPVSLAFTNGGHVHVRTDAHLNDDAPAITFRGQEFLVSLNLYAETGWTIRQEDGAPHVTNRKTWRDATRFQTEQIVKTLSAYVSAYVQANPGVLIDANRVDFANDLARVRERKQELAEELNRVMGEEFTLTISLINAL